MARKIMIAGNWKMNGLSEDGVALAREVAAEVKKLGKPACEFLVCPPFTLLYQVKKALRGAKVALGAQDAHFAVKGAHTGDISPAMLTDIGCTYVILGHSERRADHFETSELVAQKAAAAYENGLKTIICIGETEKQRDEGKTIEVCAEQIMGSVPENADAANTVIAYEPVWAIGTGKTPTPEDVEEVHAAVRKVLAEKARQRRCQQNAYSLRRFGQTFQRQGISVAARCRRCPDRRRQPKAQDFLAIAKSVC